MSSGRDARTDAFMRFGWGQIWSRHVTNLIFTENFLHANACEHFNGQDEADDADEVARWLDVTIRWCVLCVCVRASETLIKCLAQQMRVQ